MKRELNEGLSHHISRRRFGLNRRRHLSDLVACEHPASALQGEQPPLAHLRNQKLGKADSEDRWGENSS